jgi:hypothetical protein
VAADEAAGRRLDVTAGGGAPASPRRPWVGITFACCGAYSRVYRRPDADRYVGRCPRCSRQVVLRVGHGGTSARQFLAQ